MTFVKARDEAWTGKMHATPGGPIYPLCGAALPLVFSAEVDGISDCPSCYDRYAMNVAELRQPHGHRGELVKHTTGATS